MDLAHDAGGYVMQKRRGRPPRASTPPATVTPIKPAKAPFRSLRDLVTLQAQYQAQSGGRQRGMFEDCRAEIYRLFGIDHNDKQVDEMRATGATDRAYEEWERRFVRAFGELEMSEAG